MATSDTDMPDQRPKAPAHHFADSQSAVGASGKPGAVHPIVRAVVEEVLEGGKDAFMMRRRKYGF
jgi:hypothetical protein